MKVALIGGGSRSARAFLRLSRASAPDLESVAFVRRPAPDAEWAMTVVVPDYAAITADMIGDCDAVVNFVGTTRASDESEYRRVNASLALHLAETARAAGSSHFIHLSSLSVYGGAERVDEDTPTMPVSAYGRSKLEAERILSSLNDPAFRVALLRIPIIYGADSPSKLSQLAALWRLIRILPAPNPLPRRSIISYDNLAAILVDLLRTPRSGAVLAADPQAFTFELLRNALPFRAWILPLPSSLFVPVRAVAPTLHASLFASMEISSDCLLRPSDPPLIPTLAGLRAAFAGRDGRRPRKQGDESSALR